MDPTLWSKVAEKSALPATLSPPQARVVSLSGQLLAEGSWLTNALFHAFQTTARARGERRKSKLGKGPRQGG